MKTVAELMDIYCKSVGRNGTLLLNFPVMPNGLIHPTDSARGAEFRKTVEFNRIMLCEYIRLGQRVRSFSLEALVNGEWMALHDISESDDAMSTIGRKRIIRLPENVTATQLRLTLVPIRSDEIRSLNRRDCTSPQEPGRMP